MKDVVDNAAMNDAQKQGGAACVSTPTPDTLVLGKGTGPTSAKAAIEPLYDSIWDIPDKSEAAPVRPKPTSTMEKEKDTAAWCNVRTRPRERERASESTYGSIMRAAKMFLPALPKPNAGKGGPSVIDPMNDQPDKSGAKVSNKVGTRANIDTRPNTTPIVKTTNVGLPKPIHQGTPKQPTVNISWVDEDSDGIDEAILSIVEDDMKQSAAAPAPNPAVKAGANIDWRGARPKEQRLPQPGNPRRQQQKRDKDGPADKTCEADIIPIPSGAGRMNGRNTQTPRPTTTADSTPNDPVHADADKGGADAPPLGESRNNENISYAKMVTKLPWTLQESNKKRKRNKSSPKTKPNLKGIHQKPKRDIYVHGVDISVFDCMEEIEYSIAEHCYQKGVQVTFVKGLTMSAGQTDARLRVSVPEEDFDRVLDDDFWPEDIYAREWYMRNKSKRGGNQAETSGFGRN